jgi:hypothetical protein
MKVVTQKWVWCDVVSLWTTDVICPFWPSFTSIPYCGDKGPISMTMMVTSYNIYININILLCATYFYYLMMVKETTSTYSTSEDADFFNSHSREWIPNWVHSARRPLLAYWTCPGWLWGCRIWWNRDWQGKPKYSEKACTSATLSTTNPTWRDRGANPGRRGGKPAPNSLSYGAAGRGVYWNPTDNF